MPAKKQYPEDVAIAYKGSYTNAKGNGTYLKVILKEDLEAGTEIIAFPNKNKTKKNHTDPDFGFRLSEKLAPRSTNKKNAPEDDAVDF